MQPAPPLARIHHPALHVAAAVLALPLLDEHMRICWLTTLCSHALDCLTATLTRYSCRSPWMNCRHEGEVIPDSSESPGPSHVKVGLRVRGSVLGDGATGMELGPGTRHTESSL